MPSLGDRMGSFMPRLPFLNRRSREASPTAPEGGSFRVVPRPDNGAEATSSSSGFQVVSRARRPTTSSVDSVPEGWSLSPSLLSPQSATPSRAPSLLEGAPRMSRSGSPENPNAQHATFGGDDAISPVVERKLTVRNPDPIQDYPSAPSPQPSDIRASLPPSTQPLPGRPVLARLTIPNPPLAAPTLQTPRASRPNTLPTLPEDRAYVAPFRDTYSTRFTPGDGKPRPAFLPPADPARTPDAYPHPISLMPGMTPPAPQAWDPALFFQPHPPTQPLGPQGHGITSPASASASTPSTHRTAHSGSSGPQTFADMGFVHVKTRRKWYHPGTWKDKPARTLHIDQVDARKHVVLPPTPPTALPPSPRHSAASSSGAASSGHAGFGLDYYGI